MRKTTYWSDYELIDSSRGERLERWGDVILIRPDPQVIWNTERKNPLWHNAHARYIRSNTGGGKWQMFKKVPASWQVKYRDLVFNVKPMGFKHTGVFPEQAANWDLAADIIRRSDRQLNILNLFGYTGRTSLRRYHHGSSVLRTRSERRGLEARRTYLRVRRVVLRRDRRQCGICDFEFLHHGIISLGDGILIGDSRTKPIRRRRFIR